MAVYTHLHHQGSIELHQGFATLISEMAVMQTLLERWSGEMQTTVLGEYRINFHPTLRVVVKFDQTLFRVQVSLILPTNPTNHVEHTEDIHERHAPLVGALSRAVECMKAVHEHLFERGWRRKE